MTALEIYSNPRDLVITVFQQTDDALFAVGIQRGPGHNYKPLLSSKPQWRTADEAIEIVEYYLESARAFCEKELANENSALNLFTRGELVDRSKVLTVEFIAQIVADLREKKIAQTHTYPVPVSS